MANPANMPTMKAEVSKNIPDGEHTGELVSASYEQRGEQQFPYIDVVIREKETGVELKAGYPANRVTTGSAVGRLLERFGFNLRKAAEAGEDVDWTVLKVGTPVSFSTSTEETSKGKFARVDPESVKPLQGAGAQRRR